MSSRTTDCTSQMRSQPQVRNDKRIHNDVIHHLDKPDFFPELAFELFSSKAKHSISNRGSLTFESTHQHPHRIFSDGTSSNCVQ